MTFRLTVDKQEVLLRWAAERIGMPYGWVADSEAMGVLDASDKVVAVGVLNMVADRQGWLHIASDGNRRWANRTILGGMFTMVMLVDIKEASVPFGEISNVLDAEGERLGMTIRIQREDIFNAMHRI